MRRQLLVSGVSVAAVRLAGAFLSFAVTILLGRLLGPSGLGLYAYVITCLTIATVPISYGWATLLLRTASASRHHGTWGETRAQAICGAQGAAILALVLLALAVLGLLILPGLLPDTITPLVLTLLAAVLFFDQLSALRTAILRGLDRPVMAQIPEMVARPAVLLAALAGFAFLTSATLLHAFLALLAASFVNLLVGYALLRQSAPVELSHEHAHGATLSWVARALPMAGSAGLTVLNAHIDIVVLGFFSGAADVGIYRVAVQAGLLSGLVYTSLNMLANQRFAYYRAAGDGPTLQASATLMARVAFLCTLPLPLVLLIAGEPLIRSILGEPFAPALEPTIILALSQVINALIGMPRSLLMMSGMEKRVLALTVLGLAANVLLCLALIPTFGVMGAAYANLLSTAILNGLLWYVAYQRIGMDMSVLGFRTRRPYSARARGIHGRRHAHAHRLEIERRASDKNGCVRQGQLFHDRSNGA